MSDLDAHGLRWRLRGLPIYDDDDEQIGVTTEPQWSWSDLTDEQRQRITEAAEAYASFPMSDATAWAFTLGHFGVTCPHRWTNNEPIYRVCDLCNSIERLPGRIVDVGGTPMRVADPPPPTLRLPIPADNWTMWDGSLDEPVISIEFTEYRWTGSRYVLANR